MKRSILNPVMGSALLALSTVFPSAADESVAVGAHQPVARRDMVLVTITASVEDVDPSTREVTLKGPLGNKVTFVVDKRVKRLNEVKIGDTVQADYFIGFAAELRKPTPEEEKNPLVIQASSGKAGAEESPAAGDVKTFKVVTTV